jgi:HSP20 family molecular chaperone IbpA
LGSIFGETPFSGLTETWAPSVDISETKDNFIVKAEIPGLEAKDVNVTISGDLLTIKGEKKKEQRKRMSTAIVLRDITVLSSASFNCRAMCRLIKSRRSLTKVS